jgi:hypothetical protein
MAFNTHIDGLSLHELLRVISNSTLSGILTVVDRTAGTGRVVFTWGRITHASTDGQERLGEALVRRGVITAEGLQQALKAQKEQVRARPLGTILSALGLADTSQIQATLRQQMKDAFFQLAEWQDGLAHFHADIATALASVRLDVSLDTQVLLLEAARRRDEALGRSRGLVPAEPAPAEPVVQAQAIEDSSEWELLTPKPAAAAAPPAKPAGTPGKPAATSPDRRGEATPPVKA